MPVRLPMHINFLQQFPDARIVCCSNYLLLSKASRRGGAKDTNRRAVFDLAANSDASKRVLGAPSRPVAGPAPSVPAVRPARRTPVGRPPPPRGPPGPVGQPRGRPKVTHRRAIFDLAANSDAAKRVLGAPSRPHRRGLK